MAVALATVVVKAGTAIREVAVANSFGRSDTLDAFLFAFILPSFAVNLVVGAVSAALVPVLVDARQKDGVTAGQQLLASVLLLTSGALVAVALLLVLLASLHLPWLGHNFPPQKQLLTREFLCLLAPWLILNGLATFLACVLNAIEKFAVPALVPVLTPAAVLICIAAWSYPGSGFALALGTVVGGLLEAALLFYLARKSQILGPLRWYGANARVRAVLTQTSPMMAGCLLMGATPVVDQFMAAMLGSGSVSALSYGGKVPTALLAIGATALSTATLPYFSRMAADGDWQGCRHTLKRYSALMLSVTIPLSVMLVAFSRPLVKLLFQRGAFTGADTDVVSKVQAFYSLQIPFYVLCLLFVRFISSVRRNDLLMYTSAINLIVDVAMNLVLMRVLGVAGIALSTAIVMVGSLTFLSMSAFRLLNRQSAIMPATAHASARQ